MSKQRGRMLRDGKRARNAAAAKAAKAAADARRSQERSYRRTVTRKGNS